MHSLFYVDLMGNLLQSQKLAFYENLEGQNFISKMFQSGNETSAREVLCKSYDIIRDIYDSILTPARQAQIRNDPTLYQ